MVPRATATPAPYVDVTAAMDERPQSRARSLKVVPHPGGAGAVGHAIADEDPFSAVEVRS
jgi:hypothetical protein